MRLRVTTQGVLVTVPASMPSAPVLQFLEDQRAWIQAQALKIPSAGLPPYTSMDAWEVPLAGHVIPVQWNQAPVSRAEIIGDDDAIHAFAPDKASDASRRSVVQQALMARLRTDVAGMLAKWVPTIPGGSISRLVIAPTQAQWGSMSTKHRLSLASSLVGVRRQALEYVVIHELCHQIHMNHSPSFWREVRTRCPGYRGEEQYLGRVGAQVNALMARLHP